MPFASQEEAINWMIATQLGRRNLTSGQKSYLRGKRYNLEKQKEGAPQGNQNAAEQLTENRSVVSASTRERLADEYGVAPSTIQADAAFADAVDTLEDQVRADIRETILKRQRNGTGATTKKQAVTAAKAVKARTVGMSKLQKNFSATPVPVKIPFATYFMAAATVPARAVLDTPRWVAFSRA
jgi:hypothetical protein